MNRMNVSNAPELHAACKDGSVTEIFVTSDLIDLPSLRLQPGQSLRGAGGKRFVMRFHPGIDCICLTTGNSISDLVLAGSPDRRVVWNDHTVGTLGTFSLSNLEVTGQVQILARDEVTAGHLEVNDLHILSADTRAAKDQPSGYGVSVLQGAFTYWNMQSKDVLLTANLNGLAIGLPAAPVLGGGVLVSGFGAGGGRLRIERLETKGIYTDGSIARGTPDRISGGVFTLHGASVDLVLNNGPVTTWGSNDMALDNWGHVDRWMINEKITTFGASAIGFVNFGSIDFLHAKAPIETHGEGARGFNVYSGTIQLGDFDRIVTRGDGAVGVQISQPVGELRFRRGIETFGSDGVSLVRGVMQKLSAIALSIKPGGSARQITIEGGLKTNGAHILPLEHEGKVDSLRIAGGISMETPS